MTIAEFVVLYLLTAIVVGVIGGMGIHWSDGPDAPDFVPDEEC